MSDKLISPNGDYETDLDNIGNLITYRRADGMVIWRSGGDPNPPPDPPDPPTPPDPPDPPGLLSPLVVDGPFFRLATGERWTAVEASDFNLLCRYQSGQHITPILAQRRDAGFNMLRVWTLYSLPNIGHFLDIDYARVAPFLALCASYGLYVEFTAYTSIERVDHWDRLVAACQGSTNVLLELVNEGTLPVNRIDMARYARPAGLLASHGSGGSEGDPPWEPWDYITRHTNGADEEQRKVGKQAYDLAESAGVPVLTNETSRCPEVGMWAGADAARCQALAFDAAAGASLLCAGSAYHSIAGKSSVLWTGVELDAARAWAQGARSVPLEFQAGQYVHRTDLEGPDDLRVYERRLADGRGAIVSIRK